MDHIGPQRSSCDPHRGLDVAQIAVPIDSYSGVLLAQGAEARVWKGVYNDHPVIIKERFAKHYRHPDMDHRLTKRRTKSEAKCIVRCKGLEHVLVPDVLHVDTKRARIFLEHIDAPTVKAVLNPLTLHDPIATNVAVLLGRAIASIHCSNVIHGDLTTSNILRHADGRLVLIDFGLSFVSTLAEDKAVDLYVLERALLSTHSELPAMFQVIIDSYRSASKEAETVLTKFELVRMRGRKRSMIG